MRRLHLLVFCIAAVANCGEASAGALEDALRGTQVAKYEPAPGYVPAHPVYYRWEGLYIGGQYGRSAANLDFGTGTSSLIDYILRQDVVGNHVSNWTTLSEVDTSFSSYGGFIGYNWQWSEIIVGVELNYSRAGKGAGLGSSTDTMTRTFNDDTAAPAGHHYFYTASVGSTASANVTSFGSTRLRLGYAMDKFMPYVFGGFSAGTVDVRRAATVRYVRQDIPDITVPPAPPITPQPTFVFGPTTAAEQKNNAVAFGYALGLGLDIALLPNVFLRGEWEYIQFTPVKDINISINTVRAGVAMKF